MRKKRILLQTNPTWISTGLSENAKTLLQYLYKTDKYEIAHYCTQGTSTADGRLQTQPWKCYGSIPADARVHAELQADPGKMHHAGYGAYNIDAVIKDFKPDVWIGSDDQWGFPKHAYADKPWYKQIGSIQHVTLDSLPILDAAFEAARDTKHYLSWTKFGMDAMKRVDPKSAHVGQIYGAMDTTKFSPISPEAKAELRKRFNISPTATIFIFVGRNQLRKQYPRVLEAFAGFKREHPTAEAKLLFHTAWHEQSQGWDIPKKAKEYGVDLKDVLATYACKHCGSWVVNPFCGEDVKCPFCGTDKGMSTVTIMNRVPDDQMKLIYGLADAGISAFSSGGQEYHSIQTLLCGLPLACTNYSCGVDFCAQEFVHKLDWNAYDEHGTSFTKASTDPVDIRRFMNRVWKASKRELADWGAKGRAWGIKTFSIETIGAQWEALFDSMPEVDWTKVNMTPAPKNELFAFPDIPDADTFITTLYREILSMAEPITGEGHKHWAAKIKEGMSRQDIYAYFISVAKGENVKHDSQSAGFESQIDKTTGRKRALFVIKCSMGDALMCTQLFESFHQSYPDHDLYVGTEPAHNDIFAGNPHIFKILPYIDAMQQEMWACGAGQKDPLFHVYLHPAIPTQAILGYLYSTTAAFTPHMFLT